MPPPFLALTAVDGRPTDCRVRWQQKLSKSEKDPQLGDWVTRKLPGLEVQRNKNLHLPNEILEQIIQHVTHTRTLLSLCLTSRTLYKISLLYLYRSIAVWGNWGEGLDLPDHLNKPLPGQVKLLENLSADFTKENPASAADTLPAAQIAKYVKRLYLMYTDNYLEGNPGSLEPEGPSPQSMSQLVKNCVNIEELHLVEAIVSLRKLKHLRITIESDTPASLAQLPPLTSLQVDIKGIEDARSINGAAALFRKVLETSQATLTSLVLHSGRSDGPDRFGSIFEPLVSQPESSEIVNSQPLNPTFKFKKLEKLVLNVFRIIPTGKYALGGAEVIEFSKLTYLELGNADNSLFACRLDVEWTNLKKIYLLYNDHLQDFLGNCSGLETLFITHMPYMSSNEISSLIETIIRNHGKTLKSLALKPVEAPSHNIMPPLNIFHLRKLGQGCRLLKELWMAFDFENDWYELAHTIHKLLPNVQMLHLANQIPESIPLYHWSLSHQGLRYPNADAKKCRVEAATERAIATLIKCYLVHVPKRVPPLREVSAMRTYGRLSSGVTRWYYRVVPEVPADDWGTVDWWVGFRRGLGGWEWAAMKGPWQLENGKGESGANLDYF
ncbi:hypothetical protein L873DRAFT_709842 [Choiromyces venosus 120613-1]|uniref:F-box domain-containing protein n=1 Tax=Choiromyces venosus 120613-1 TaxID=1336337 RepID=A0A3N4JRH8_9PEZI|nr:hypothetical protein L873DRAFT_709842 [Choiromyces venosus 120613-1]